MTSPTGDAWAATPLPTSLEWVIANAERHRAQFASNPQEYFRAFVKDLVRTGVFQLEKDRNRHQDADENALTDLLIAPLRSLYTVSTEENANGHTDVILKGFPGIEWRAEAKILKGFSWYRDGLTKLVEKYNSGSEGHTLMIAYCKEKNMHDSLAAVKANIETEKPANFQNWVVPPHEHPNVFAGKHLSNGLALAVTHVWTNLHYETDKALLGRVAPAKSRKKSAARKQSEEPPKVPPDEPPT